MKLTENEILDALRVAATQISNPDDAYSIVELATASGWAEHRVRRHLVTLKAQGQLDIVTVWRESLNGRMQRVTAYRFKVA